MAEPEPEPVAIGVPACCVCPVHGQVWRGWDAGQRAFVGEVWAQPCSGAVTHGPLGPDSISFATASVSHAYLGWRPGQESTPPVPTALQAVLGTWVCEEGTELEGASEDRAPSLKRSVPRSSRSTASSPTATRPAHCPHGLQPRISKASPGGRGQPWAFAVEAAGSLLGARGAGQGSVWERGPRAGHRNPVVACPGSSLSLAPQPSLCMGPAGGWAAKAGLHGPCGGWAPRPSDATRGRGWGLGHWAGTALVSRRPSWTGPSLAPCPTYRAAPGVYSRGQSRLLTRLHGHAGSSLPGASASTVARRALPGGGPDVLPSGQASDCPLLTPLSALPPNYWCPCLGRGACSQEAATAGLKRRPLC